nr:MFS transporter [Corynebacterium lactis]
MTPPRNTAEQQSQPSPPAQHETAPTLRSNASRYVWAHGLQNVGDQIIAAKTLLPWLLQAAGAPAFFIALLVPVRESGSMLPQAALTPWVKTRRRRVSVWIAGALGQAASAGLIALAALFLEGVALGIAVVAALACFATARALCSMASKDVQGRTIPKGQRGQISGRATMLGGVAAVVVGAVLWGLADKLSGPMIAGFIAAAACSWLVAVLIFRGIDEPECAEDSCGPNSNWWKDTWALFASDRDFRSFVIVRSLLLVTALSTTFIVTLSAEMGASVDEALGASGAGAGAGASGSSGGSVGIFLIASGVAALIGGKVTGLWADRSSKAVLTWSAGVGSAILLLLVAGAHWLPQAVNVWLFPLGFFAMNIVHAAVRVARSTYVVDMAEGDKRTEYVGASNTLMGIILLVVGALSGAIAMLGSSAALVFLAVIGLVGVAMSSRLKDVSHKPLSAD